MWCLEKIRNDVCYHNLNVKIVAVTGGFAYGTEGYTHHAVEDLAVMRAMPIMAVVVPGDPVETRLATNTVVVWDGPCYLRLGKTRESVIHHSLPTFVPGKIIEVKEGRNALIISSGNMLGVAMDAAQKVEADGLSIAVWSCPWIKPIDKIAILKAAHCFNYMFTIEEALIIGGLGGAVAEILVSIPEPHARLVRLGIPDIASRHAYSQNEARRLFGLDVHGIYELLTHYLLFHDSGM